MKLFSLIYLSPLILKSINIPKKPSFLKYSFRKFIIAQGIQCFNPNDIRYVKYGTNISILRTKKEKIIVKNGVIKKLIFLKTELWINMGN